MSVLNESALRSLSAFSKNVKSRISVNANNDMVNVKESGEVFVGDGTRTCPQTAVVLSSGEDQEEIRTSECEIIVYYIRVSYTLSRVAHLTSNFCWE